MNQVEEIRDYPCAEMPMVAEAREEYTKYSIQANLLDHGIMIHVGCKNFAFEDVERAITYINEYLRNPQETIKKFYNNTLFNQNQ